MPKFAANISTMFGEVSDLERIKAAKDSGFDAIEWLFPYVHPISEIKTELSKHSVQLVLVNTALGTPRAGDRGIGALPGRREDFREQFSQALEYAEPLGVSFIHVMAGVVPDDHDREDYLGTFCENLRWGLAQAAGTDVELLIEPLNRFDTPGYLHTNTNQAMEIVQKVDFQVGLQYDFYHMQLMEGNLGATVENLLPYIKHVQFSSVPGRHEPQHGEVNLDFLFRRLDELGYSGFVGCEYQPKRATFEGLSWFEDWR